MSMFWRTIVIVAIIVMVMGGLLLTADEMPSEVDDYDFLETSLGLLVLSSVFWFPVLGSLGIIALANKILTLGGKR